MTTKKTRPSDLAWLSLVAGILAYEVKARPGELLSEAVDRYLARNKYLTTGIILYTAAHLVNWLPTWADLFYHAAVLGGKTKEDTVFIGVDIQNQCR